MKCYIHYIAAILHHYWLKRIFYKALNFFIAFECIFLYNFFIISYIGGLFEMVVEPIRDQKKIKQLQNYLCGTNMRDYLLLNFGLNTGLRVGDILKLQIKDLLNEKGKFKEYLTIQEEKTGKEKKIKLNDILKKYIQDYLKDNKYTTEDYLFAGRKGKKPITRIQAYRSLGEAAKAVGIEHFGTHTMRKTWGYHTYKASRYNIGLIMDTFNHSSQAITLRYIGINQDQKDELYSLVQF